MKNTILNLVFAFSVVSFFSFQTPTQTEAIIQKSLNLTQLSEMFQKSDSGEFLPLTVVTNGLFSENMNLTYEESPVEIVRSNAGNNNLNQRVLNFTEMKMKSRKSVLEFEFDDKKVKVKMKKRAGDWVYSFISVKGGGDLYVSINEEF